MVSSTYSQTFLQCPNSGMAIMDMTNAPFKSRQDLLGFLLSSVAA